MNPIFEEDLKSDIRRILMPYAGKVNSKAPLDAHLMAYFSLSKKIIAPKPRRVVLSEQMKQRLASHPKSDRIASLLQRLESGETVIPFLSKKAPHSGAHDYMLYEWSIYHLHLDSLSASNSSVANGSKDDLMFLYLEDDVAYVLDMDRHTPTVFAEKRWLQLILDNWPDLLEKWLIKDAVDVSHDFSDEERQRMRENKINVAMVKLNGRVYMGPGLGMASSGHSSEAADRMVGVHRWLKTLERERDALRHQYSVRHSIPFDTIRLRLRITTEGIELYDQVSNGRVGLYTG